MSDTDATPTTSVSDTSSTGGASAPDPGSGGATGGESTAAASPESAATPSFDFSTFDVTAWDGLPDSLPEPVRPVLKRFIDRKSKDLESGYTKKFQDLSAERKKFEKDLTDWQQGKEELERQLAIYKALASGDDDPRLTELQTTHDTLQKEKAALNEQLEQLKKHYQQTLEEGDRSWLTEFKERHKDIYQDNTKRADLLALVNAGWEPEAAVELVDCPDDVREAAAEIAKTRRLSEDQHKLAVEYARMKLQSSATPRPAALATQGAGGQRNQASVPGSIRGLPINKARDEAARLALQSMKPR